MGSRLGDGIKLGVGQRIESAVCFGAVGGGVLVMGAGGFAGSTVSPPSVKYWLINFSYSMHTDDGTRRSRCSCGYVNCGECAYDNVCFNKRRIFTERIWKSVLSGGSHLHPKRIRVRNWIKYMGESTFAGCAAKFYPKKLRKFGYERGSVMWVCVRVCVLRVGGCWALYIWRLFWQLKQYTIWSILMGPNARLVCSGGSVGKKRKYRDWIILRSKMLAKRKICCEQFRAEYETTWRPRSFFWMSAKAYRVCESLSQCVCVCVWESACVEGWKDTGEGETRGWFSSGSPTRPQLCVSPLLEIMVRARSLLIWSEWNGEGFHTGK